MTFDGVSPFLTVSKWVRYLLAKYFQFPIFSTNSFQLLSIYLLQG